MATYVVLKKGINAQVDGALAMGAYRCGNPWVQIPTDGATVPRYTPALAGSDRALRNGAQLNPRGEESDAGGTAQQGLDGRPPYLFDERLCVRTPIRVMPWDVLVIGKSCEERASADRARPSYWPSSTGRSWLDEMMVVTFTDRPVAPNEMRPMAIGGAFSKFLRRVAVYEQQLQVDRLPSVVDYAALGVSGPNVPGLLNVFSDFGGEILTGWATDQVTPQNQHPGYGREMAAVVSQALVHLCSTAPIAEKLELARRLVPWGMDLAGAFADGRQNGANGGHMQGRKALIVLAGHLLGLPQMADPTGFLGARRFQEDHAYFDAGEGRSAWFFPGWRYGWRYQQGWGDYLKSPPSAWTRDERGQVWATNGYLSHCCSAQVGTALAMRLLDRTREWGAAADGMIAQFMQGPTAAAGDAIRAAGVHVAWGTDYGTPFGSDFCAAAWKRYAG